MAITREDAIKKVEACFALSKSSNPNEAATALKQAHALIAKYKLEGVVFGATVIEKKIPAPYKKSGATWQFYLMNNISKLFDCFIYETKYKNGDIDIVICGSGSNPDITAYAFDVVFRQSKKAKREYRETLTCDRSEKMKLTSAFLTGWSVSVVKNVKECFVSDTYSDEVREYKESLSLDGEATSRHKELVSQEQYNAFFSGSEVGKDFQVSKPLN